MQKTDEDPEIPVSIDDFTVIDPATGEAFNAQEREQLAADMDHPVLLTIAPSEPSGVRGGAFDVRVFQALGAHGCAILTGIYPPEASPPQLFSSDLLDAQWNAVMSQTPPLAVKISGELSGESVQWLGEKLSSQEIFTVAVAELYPEACTEVDLQNWRFYLLPYLSVLILTRGEASLLSGQACDGQEGVESCASALLQYGCRSVAIVEEPLSSAGRDPVCDFWSNGTQSAWLRSQGVPGSGHRDGHWDVAGCALTVYQAQAFNELDALVLARMQAQQALGQRYPLGGGREALWVSGSFNRKDLIPELTETRPAGSSDLHCAPLRDLSPGLIPVAGKAEELAPVLESGSRTAVLYIVNKNHPRLAEEIQTAVQLGDRHEAQLFIQQHWRLALKHDAFGLLLHASELMEADLEKIATSGVRLGVIIRSYTDLAAAMSARPSCIIIGPLFTPEVDLEHPPVGMDLFKAMRRMIPVPVFAFGGITPELREELQTAGADGFFVDPGECLDSEKNT